MSQRFFVFAVLCLGKEAAARQQKAASTTTETTVSPVSFRFSPGLAPGALPGKGRGEASA